MSQANASWVTLACTCCGAPVEWPESGLPQQATRCDACRRYCRKNVGHFEQPVGAAR